MLGHAAEAGDVAQPLLRDQRQHFLDRLLRDDIEITGDESVRELLGIDRVSA